MEVSKKDTHVATTPVVNQHVAEPSSSACDNDVQVELRNAVANYVPDTKLEKLLVRKIDLFMIPTLWFMCILAYLDRNNIGNANAAGMSHDLGLDDQTYAMLISIFFIGYLIYEVPSNMILTRVNPSWYLPGLQACWGVLVAGMSQVKNYHTILVCRFFLGVLEAGFMPGVLYLMTCWYKRHEMGKRFSVFFTALCFAGAASGLISGAVISGLEGAHGMEGWRWLFLIEGVITVCWAGIARFILLDYPATTRRLTPEERQLATVRILHDKQATSAQATNKLKPWDAFVASLVDLRTYFFMVLYILDNGCAAINYFIPTLLQDMGYGGVSAQWMTIPIWAVGIVFLCTIPQLSDHLRERRWHITSVFLISFVSSLIITLVPASHHNVRFAFICFYIAGVYSGFPLILTWASETMALPAEKRAVATAAVNAVGNLAVVYGSQLWPATDAPEYRRGFTAMSAFCGAALLLAAAMPVVFRYLPSFSTKAERELAVIDGEEVEAQ